MTHLQQIAAQLWDAGFKPLPTNGKTSGPEQVRLNLNGATTSHNGCSERPSTSTSGTRAASASLCGKSNPGDPLGLEVTTLTQRTTHPAPSGRNLSKRSRAHYRAYGERLTACVVRTPSGGYHLHYLCAEVAPKQTAAGRCIEIPAPATSPCSPTPGYYIEGGEAIDIHEITVTEREALHSIIRSLRQETPEEGTATGQP